MTKPSPFHSNQLFPNMLDKKRDLYFGDTVNTLGHEDHSFQLFEEFKWYTTLSPKEKC
jgi:hypothetical protein